jgi:hypothetical protein
MLDAVTIVLTHVFLFQGGAGFNTPLPDLFSNNVTEN